MAYSVPYSFVPGTKAKASEVNANFTSILNNLNNSDNKIDNLENEVITIKQNINNNKESITKIETEIENKANKQEIDGNWINKGSTLSTATSSGLKTFDLKSYLPNDDYNYEVIVSSYGYQSGTNAHTYIYTDILTFTSYKFLTVADTSRQASNTCIFPIGKERKLYHYVSTNFSSLYLILLGYKRLGKK